MDPPVPGKPTFAMFKFSPNLRTLFGYPKWISHFNLAFSNITTFNLAGIAVCAAYGYLLSLMPNVRKIKIRFDAPGSSHDNPYPEVLAVISLPHLEIATLEDDGEMMYSNRDFCILINRLCVPALQELDLLISTRFTQKLRGLLTRSRCHLIKVSVRNIGCLPRDNRWEYDLGHLEILRDIPSLVSLTLSNPNGNFGNAVLERLWDVAGQRFNDRRAQNIPPFADRAVAAFASALASLRAMGDHSLLPMNTDTKASSLLTVPKDTRKFRAGQTNSGIAESAMIRRRLEQDN
ncbi:hypothetical protein C8J56DRAFT_1083079 [Mycena floridula]|nr:hypothetical protein C8J56DRAFT_1083079 [Mycena floridula]